MQEVFDRIYEKIKQNSYIVVQKNNSEELGMTLTGIKQALDEMEKEYNNGWIPCSERLPEDCDMRFYMCIVENHEEDLPMFCQYEEECGFGYWHDIYDEHTLGFVDSEFRTNEELGYEKVIAWQPLPEPYHPNNGHYGCNQNGNHERCDVMSCGIYESCQNKNKIWFDQEGE